jgi:L-fuconate dehydratase
VIRNGHYVAPLRPGMGAQLHQQSIEEFSFPDGAAWRD